MEKEIKKDAKTGSGKRITRPTGNKDAIGDAGLNQYADNTNFTTEYLPELQGISGSQNYEKMSKSDPIVGMILAVYKNPIASANWTVPPVEDSTAEEKLATDFVRDWFFESYTVDFCTLLYQILSCLEYGYSAFERVYKIVNFEGNKYFAPTIQQRLQTSIENIYPDKGEVQQQTNKSGLVTIPMENMIFFTLNRSGSDMRGRSLLRNAYRPWKKNNYYEENLGMGMQRNASGVPSMTVPEGTDPESDDYVATELLLKNFAMSEDAYMILPENWKFEIFEGKFDPKKALEVITAYDKRIATSVLAQFILLGQGGSGGAFALSRDHSDLFLDGLNYIVSFIEKTIHRQIIVPMVKLNFGDSVDASKIRIRGLNLNKKAGAEMAEVLAKLTPDGYVNPTVQDEVSLRAALDMPPLTEEQLKERIERGEINPTAAPVVPKATPAPAKPSTKGGDDEDIDGKVKDDDKKSKQVKLSESKSKARKEFVDTETKIMRDFMKANLLLIKDKFMADVEATLKRGKVSINGLKKIEVSTTKYRKGLEMKLGGLANEGWTSSKKTAKTNKVKLAEDFNPKKLSDKQLTAYVLNQAQLLSEDQVTSMTATAIATASGDQIKGFSINQTMSNVDKAIEQFIEGQKVAVGSSLSVVSSFNFGENEFNKEIEDQLWGYRFTAVDDGNTTQICSHYSGKTYSSNSPELSIVTPPLHANCRSYMEPIYKATESKPKIDDSIAPPSIQTQKTIF